MHNNGVDLQWVFCHDLVYRAVPVHPVSTLTQQQVLFSVMSPEQRVNPQHAKFPYVYWVASPSPRKTEKQKLGGGQMT